LPLPADARRRRHDNSRGTIPATTPDADANCSRSPQSRRPGFTGPARRACHARRRVPGCVRRALAPRLTSSRRPHPRRFGPWWTLRQP